MTLNVAESPKNHSSSEESVCLNLRPGFRRAVNMQIDILMEKCSAKSARFDQNQQHPVIMEASA